MTNWGTGNLWVLMHLDPSTNRDWRAGNIARSRLSAGPSPISTRPQKFFSRSSQSRLYRILLNVRPNAFELITGPNQTIKTFLLPKRSMSAQQSVGLMSCKPLERTQPFCSQHVRSSQQMNMIRHYDEGVELVPVQFAVSMVERRHHHLCDCLSPQKQRTAPTCIQQPVNSHECLARRYQCGRREDATSRKTAVQAEGNEQRLFDYIPMGQPPFVMPHTSSWCASGGEILTSFQSRLKAGCGQYCPPSNRTRQAVANGWES